MAKASVKDVKDYFGMDLTTFKKEWMQGGLSDQDKNDLMQGLGDGSLTY
jgi:hypothetical protein